MGVLLYLILLFVSGLFIGGIARLALPGPDPMSLTLTALVGITGSLAGGLVMWAIVGDPAAGGFIVSEVFAVAIVYLLRRRRDSLAARRRPRV